MMRHLGPPIVTLLSLACGNEPTSPSSSLDLPTAPPLPAGVPNGPPLTIRGGVWDTASLPISNAQVQVVAPSRGPVAVTDGNEDVHQAVDGVDESGDRAGHRVDRRVLPRNEKSYARMKTSGRSTMKAPGLRRCLVKKAHTTLTTSGHDELYEVKEPPSATPGALVMRQGPV